MVCIYIITSLVYKLVSHVWLIYAGGAKVYDITTYLNQHPGGREILLEFAGKNADSMFEDIGHSRDARNMLAKYQIGVLMRLLSFEEVEKVWF